MKYKYAFYCSGGASRVRDFYKTFNFIDYPFEFLYYDGKRPAIENDLESNFGKEYVFCPQILKEDNRKEYNKIVNEELLDLLNKKNVDFLFCFGEQIIRKELLTAYKNKIINFHPSLLPAFPGLNSIDQALNSSVQFLGNTAHFIDEGIDTGLIIHQSVLARGNFKNYNSVLDLQIPMLKKIWEFLEKDAITVDENKVRVSINGDSYSPLFSW